MGGGGDKVGSIKKMGQKWPGSYVHMDLFFTLTTKFTNT